MMNTPATHRLLSIAENGSTATFTFDGEKVVLDTRSLGFRIENLRIRGADASMEERALAEMAKRSENPDFAYRSLAEVLADESRS